MARADILNIMYSKEKSPLDFKFDSLWMPSMYYYLTVQDIEQLRMIATSNRYAAKIQMKYKAIDEIMIRRGFRKFHCGTNRIVYRYLEDQSFLVKIALDDVGMKDNPREYRNQFILKPFVTKMFEVSPCGTVAFVERVQPITSRQEFQSVAEDIYEMLINCVIGKYVLEDIGTKYFMNYGLRNGFGVVLLDYPYVFELDGNKLYCNKVFPSTNTKCNGEIDYDAGFNELVCTSCGKKYLAQELEISIQNKLVIMKEEGELDMKITLKKGNKIILEHNTEMERDFIIRKSRTVSGPKNIPVYLNGVLMNEEKPKQQFKGNKSTKYEKDRINNNKDKDFKPKDCNKEYKPKDDNKEFKYSNKFQNRKNQGSNSRLDKFNKFQSNNEKETLLDKESIDKAKEAIAKSNEERQETIEEQVTMNLVGEQVEKENDTNKLVNTDNEILAQFNLSEDSFKEPECYDNKDDEDYSIYEEY